MTLGDTLAKGQAAQDLGAKALRVLAGELTGAKALFARTADTCDAMRGSQEAGLGGVRDLAAAVRGLPELSHSLEAASAKIRDASGSLASLGGLVDRFGALDGLTDRIGEAAGALDSIRHNTATIAEVRDALAKDVGDNGDRRRVDAISAIEQMNLALKGMNDALAEQINNMNKVNTAQIANAMRNVSDANRLLAGGLDGLQAQMGALNRSFVDLSSDIRNIALGLAPGVGGGDAVAAESARDG
jgi:methyl-accepting chemotaxis protein